MSLEIPGLFLFFLSYISFLFVNYLRILTVVFLFFRDVRAKISCIDTMRLVCSLSERCRGNPDALRDAASTDTAGHIERRVQRQARVEERRNIVLGSNR